MTVSEVFAKQLLQLSGVSPDKAVAILEKFPTPIRYRAEFHNLKHFYLLFTVMHFFLLLLMRGFTKNLNEP